MTNINDKQIIGNPRSGRIGNVSDNPDCNEILNWDPSKVPVVPKVIGPVNNSTSNVQTGKIRFLGDDWGEKVLGRVLEKYGVYHAMGALSYHDGIVKGTSAFYVVAVNEVLNPFGIRTATQADLELILRNGALSLNSCYGYTSLIWRSNDDPNGYLARDIYIQFRNRKGITFKEGTPYVIPLNGLGLKVDLNSRCGLSFVVNNKTTYFEDSILNEPSPLYFENQDIDEKTGLPKQVRPIGSRQFYTRNSNSYSIKNSGLSLLILQVLKDVGAHEEDLTKVIGLGRIVCLADDERAFERLGSNL